MRVPFDQDAEVLEQSSPTTMPDDPYGALPPPPSPPAGVPRFDHRPTVEAGIRYWRAVEAAAMRAGDRRRARTARGLKDSYQDALRALLGRDDAPG